MNAIDIFAGCVVAGVVIAASGCCGDHQPRTANIIERYEFGKGYNVVEVQGIRFATLRVLGEVGEKISVLPSQIQGGTSHCDISGHSAIWSFGKTETTLDEEYIARAVRLLREIEARD